MEKNLSEYLDNHFNGMHGSIPCSPSINWIDVYRGNMRAFNNIQNDSFQHEFAYLQEHHKTLSREDIFQLFENDIYRGFVAAMLWGGIGTGGGQRNIQLAMSTPRKDIEDKLKSVKNYLDRGEIKNAFKSFCRENKIKGVGISFFTKLMFFLGNNKSSDLRPLIYDNQLQQLHLSLLKDKGPLSSIFTIRSLSVTDSDVSATGYYQQTIQPEDFYYDYLQKMKELSKKYQDKLETTGQQGPIGRLEEILFGWSLKLPGAKCLANPRFFVNLYLNDFREYKKNKHHAEQPLTQNHNDSETSQTSNYENKLEQIRGKYSHMIFTLGGNCFKRQNIISTRFESDGHLFTLFIGKNGGIPLFCEIIAEDGSVPPYEECFIKRRKGKIRIYHYSPFAEDKIDDAIRLMDDILSQVQSSDMEQ